MSICDIQRYKKPHLVAQIWGINIPAVYIPAHEFHVCLVQSSYTVSTPAWLIMLRALAFLACAFLVTLAVYGSGDLSSPSDGSHILKGGVAPPKHTLQNNTEAKVNDSTGSGQMWSELVGLLSEEAVENAKLIWESGSNHQMAVASVGLLTCITGVLMAGPVRWRALSFFFHHSVSCCFCIVPLLHLLLSFLLKVKENWRLRFFPLAPRVMPVLCWVLPEDGHPRLAGRNQARRYLLVLLGWIRRSRGHTQAHGSEKSQRPQVRIRTVTLH